VDRVDTDLLSDDIRDGRVIAGEEQRAQAHRANSRYGCARFPPDNIGDVDGPQNTPGTSHEDA
jgi:hypothetical protein